MILSEFAGKKVGLLGAGSENLALLPHLMASNASVTVCDRSDKATVEARVNNNSVELRTGEGYLNGLDDFDYVFRIAGLPVREVEKVLAELKKKPTVTSPINLFLKICPATTIGVTGTKGKGTTSTLLASLLKQSGKGVWVGGNIEEPVFGFIDQLTSESLVVLELSSFQLEDVTHSPGIAVLLPITVDHLSPLSAQNPNYHESLEDYSAAKGNITAFQEPQDLLVYAEDSPTTLRIAAQSAARKIGVGGSEKADIQINSEGKLLSSGHELVDLKKVGLRGEHIFLDAALAVAVARELGVTVEQMERGFELYKPLPHRLEKIATIEDVTYYDDSYATAPDAAIAAIKSFSEPITWIGGGSSKGADFSELAKVISDSNVRRVILLGQEGSRIAESLHQTKFTGAINIASSLAAAVTLAKDSSHSGEVVLLSPACASKDMFANAADRGEQFVKAVKGGENGGQL